MKPFFSIIIPIRIKNDYLKETLSYLKKQTYQNFEILVITDKISKHSSPAIKRNIGAKEAKGRYLAFLDDDSYPTKFWLKNIKKQIGLHPSYTAFCGPALTPSQNNIFQKASGLVWSSKLGSGGAGTYRNKVQIARFVDDYPTVNFIIKKSDFIKVGGFNPNHWPGEDTLLCLDLIKANKKIYYHPSIIVFHHRRKIILPHLKQISRYALHRGHFAKIFPKNSRKLAYFMPSFFLIYCLSLIVISVFVKPPPTVFIPILIYLALLIATLVNFFITNSPIISLLATITIPVTHFYYGFLFLVGFIRKDLGYKAHKVNKKTGHYIGG